MNRNEKKVLFECLRFIVKKVNKDNSYKNVTRDTIDLDELIEEYK